MSVQQEELITKILQMKEWLIGRGIPFEEATRAALAYYNEVEPPEALPWPGPVTGIDNAGNQPRYLVPDTGSPPIFIPNAENDGISTDFMPSVGLQGYMTDPTPDPLGAVKTNEPKYSPEGSNIAHTYNITNYPTHDDQTNWLGIANVPESQPPTLGTTGFNYDKAIPEWRYPVEQSQMVPLGIPNIAIYPSGMLNETEPELMEYIYQNHDNSDVCNQFGGRVFDMNDRSHRPVPPSEGLGYTNTHPNCICYWKPTGKVKADKIEAKGLHDIQTIHRKIGQKARADNLHKVKQDGELSQRTGARNYYRKPLKMIREAIAEVRHEFGWLTDEYLNKAKAVAEAQGGALYLIRASQEAVTDHRSEGEPYRRLLAGEELRSMSRTAIGKSMDINHEPRFTTEATILDSEYDPMTKSIQMLILEMDPEVNAAIQMGVIEAVSINGGQPRGETIEPCQHNCLSGDCELCVVPRGVILGENDGIALTWVVSAPNGMMWKGNAIPHAQPGVRTTIIQRV